MTASGLQRISCRSVLSWALILGLFLEVAIRAAAAWIAPTGNLVWMLGRERLAATTERDLHRIFTGKKGQRVDYGAIKINFNNLGYRSTKDQILPKTPGVFRVMCLGDSVTFGAFDRDYEDTWPGALEQILMEGRPGQDAEVLNFGMNHYTLATNLVNLALLGQYLQPDMVIYLVGPNDIINLYMRDFAVDGSHEGTVLFPILDSVWGFHPVVDFVRRSRVCNFLYVCAVKVAMLLQTNKTFDFKLSPEDLAARLEIIGLHISTLNSLSKAIGATPVLCAPVFDRERLIKKQGKQIEPVLKTLETFFNGLAQSQSTILVEAQDRMKDHPDCFRDEFHINALGAKRFARALMEDLQHRRLLPLDAAAVRP